MRYIPNTPEVAQSMLSDIGVASLDDLFKSIPNEAQLKRELAIPDGMPERDQLNYFKEMAAQNEGSSWLHFLGAGSYDHFIPLVIDSLISRAEFFTAYTPYQPEVCQGTLQAIFEFQSFITYLSGLDVANASVYDGSSALIESVMMADRIQRKRKRVLIPASLHPNYLSVLKTNIHNLPIELDTLPYDSSGRIDIEQLKVKLSDDVICVVVQQPNFYGVVEELQEVSTQAKAVGALSVALTTEALSLAVLEAPGHLGFDIVAGEGQSFGVPMAYGGPYVGFMATRDEYKRHLPGRMVGKTQDLDGREGYVLTLATREQHIRRERATSNICTNQNLIMLMATTYLTLMGKNGLNEVAHQNISKMAYFRSQLSKLDGYSVAFSGDVFNEITLFCPKPAAEVIQHCQSQQLLPGVDLGQYAPELANALLVNITENKSKAQIDQLLAALAEV